MTSLLIALAYALCGTAFAGGRVELPPAPEPIAGLPRADAALPDVAARSVATDAIGPTVGVAAPDAARADAWRSSGSGETAIAALDAAATAKVSAESLFDNAGVVGAVARYWDHPDTRVIVDGLRHMARMSYDKKPFRLSAKVQEEGNTLHVIVNTLASPRFVYGGWGFYITRLNRVSRRYDATLPKAISAIVHGALERRALNPAIERLRVSAPSLMNDKLVGMLRRVGFTDAEPMSVWQTGQATVGSKSSLRLDVDLRRLDGLRSLTSALQ